MVKARRRELAVLGLRVWLASLGTSDPSSLDPYRRWRKDTTFPTPNRFGAFGGFTQLKREALNANAQSRREHGDVVPPSVLARVDEVLEELARPVSVVRLPFSEALPAVLAGPHAERQPPKQ